MLVAMLAEMAGSLSWLPGDRWYTYVIMGGIFLAVIMGSWAGAVASQKGRSMQVWFLIGFFIPVIGLVASYVVKPKKVEKAKESDSK